MVRRLGRSFKNCVEINFEDLESIHETFEKNLDVERILRDIQLVLGETIVPGKTLLFLDEIQSCPRALLSLRYFYEKMPDLHVIAAGSLLDFAIDEIGVPVGRVSFMYLYPMSFIEFLWAIDEEYLAQAIQIQVPYEPFSQAVHEKALRLVGEYIAIGGMPEAVALWREKKNYKHCVEVHHDLLAAYQEDFQKYSRAAQIKYVEHMFAQIPHQVGERFFYRRVSGDFRKRDLQPALELLKKAKIITSITHTSGFGYPLGAQAKPEENKIIMLDVALTQSLLGLTAESWMLEPEKAFINKGAIAEAFVGQEMLAYGNPRQLQQLYYWFRESRSSQAEVDYLAIDEENKIVPIEVKAGKGTTLKSMRMFLDSHSDAPYGIRYSTQNYSVYDNIHSYPLYAVAAFFLRDHSIT